MYKSWGLPRIVFSSWGWGNVFRYHKVSGWSLIHDLHNGVPWHIQTVLQSFFILAFDDSKPQEQTNTGYSAHANFELSGLKVKTSKTLLSCRVAGKSSSSPGGYKLANRIFQQHLCGLSKMLNVSSEKKNSSVKGVTEEEKSQNRQLSNSG